MELLKIHTDKHAVEERTDGRMRNQEENEVQ